MNRLAWATTSALLLAGANCLAQPVYKCGPKGAIVYSHDPCPGAQVVDTTPTQGLDRSSGQSRKGADVQRIENRKLLDEALRPLTGLPPEQMEKRRKRYQLSAMDQAECGRLDAVLEPQRGAKAGAATDGSLFEQRRRFRELRC